MLHKNLAPQDAHSPSQEQVENNTLADISSLKCVVYTGIGTLYPSVTLANATSDVRGITQSIIQSGSRGYILVYGLTYNINTSMWPAGTSLFADATGSLTDVSGGGPQVANVLKQHATLGVIQVTCLDTPAAGTVLVQDTDSVNLDTLGNLVTADVRLSTNLASTDNMKATTTIKSGPSKGLHVEYPFATMSQDGILKATDWATFNGKVNQNDNRFSSQNTLRVKKNPGLDEFLTIEAAIATIVGSGPNNRYLIDVGVGVFEENKLTLPSYVSVSGSSIQTTIIAPLSGLDHLFVMQEGCELSFMSLYGAVDSLGSNKAAIYFEDVGDFAQMHKLSIYDFDIGLDNYANLADSILYSEYVDINGDYSYAVRNIAANGFEAKTQLENFYTYPSNSTIKTAILSEGATSNLLLHLVGLIGSPSGGNGVVLRNGGTVSIDASFLQDMGGIGINSENTGAGQVLKINSTTFNDCTQNITIANAGTTGFLSGYSDYLKTTINPASAFFITNKDPKRITVSEKGGDFTSIKAAIDSITDNSVSNRYQVFVGPGVFIEDTITMKEYVDIIGSSSAQTIIQVDGPNKDLILGIRHAELNRCTLDGVSGTGYCLVRLVGQTGYIPQEILSINECIFGTSDTLVICTGGTGPATIFIEDCSFGDGHPFVTGFVVNKLATDIGRIVIRNSNTIGGTVAPFPDDLFVLSGQDCELLISACLVSISLSTPQGNGVRISDGGRLRIIGSSFRGCDKGLFVENIGAAPKLEVMSAQYAINTIDLDIAHPNTIGALNASAAFSKTIISSTSPSFTISLTDPEVPGILFNGKLNYIENDPNYAVNIAPLVTNGSTMGVINGGILTISTGLSIDVSAGFGYLMSGTFPSHTLRRYDWADSSLALPASTSSYVYVNSSGTLTFSSSVPYTATVILLGRVIADATSILYIESAPLQAHHYNNQLDRLMREALGPVYASGSITTETGVRQLAVTSGKYYFSEKQYLPTGGSPVTWDSYYRSITPGVYTRIPTQTVVSNTQYDDGSGTLASIPLLQYAKHALWILGGPIEKYLLVYAQATYPSQAAAETAPLPIPPGFVADSFARLATTIVHEGTANIIATLDERPRLGFNASNTSSTASHSALSDLANDDHLQYLRTDGSRIVTGNLDMGNNNVINVNLVDGVDVSAHASRHLPNGVDPITTAAPLINVGGNTANGVGIANSLARSDHQHGIATGTPSTLNPDQINAAGTSNNLARADHIHNIPADVAVGLDANSTSTEGVGTSFARNDHTHDLATGTVIAQVPDQVNAEGTSANLARADHVHNIPTAAPVSASADGTNSQGVATTFARADHKHNINVGTPVTQNPDQINAAGVSSNLARADHVHNIPADAPTTILSPATANTEGVGTSFARNDHTHSIATGLVGEVVTIQPDATTAAGTIDKFARVDHRHAIVTDAPSTTLSPATTNAEGISTSFTRADHTHAIATGLVGEIVTIQPDDTAAAGTVDKFARVDHRHAIAAASATTIDISTTNTEGASTSFARADHTHKVNINNSRVASTTLITTTSTTYVVMTGQTLTPPAGTYWTNIRANVITTSNNRLINLAIFANGSIIADSEIWAFIRTGSGFLGGTSDTVPMNSEAFITVDGTQAIDMRWFTSGGTAQAQGYSLALIKVA